MNNLLNMSLFSFTSSKQNRKSILHEMKFVI